MNLFVAGVSSTKHFLIDCSVNISKIMVYEEIMGG